MKKFKVLLVFLIFFNNTGSQNLGRGYQFSLFKNTPNWELAKAVEKEDANEINLLLKTGNYNINLQEPKFGTTLLMLAIGNDKYESTKSLLENGASVNIKDSFQTSPIFEASKFIELKKNH
ncbi:MAG TPA: ankyrin repeat domain-containing protein [Puia sp.]